MGPFLLGSCLIGVFGTRYGVLVRLDTGRGIPQNLQGVFSVFVVTHMAMEPIKHAAHTE